DANRVAAAVAGAYPERALEIYRGGVDGNLGPASQNSYEAVGLYLRKMRPVLRKLGRDDEWTKLVEEIREQHRNRPRFMEVLDKVEGRSIMQTQKQRRGK